MSILTHTSIVQSQTKMRRERLLPLPGEVVAGQGQEVKPVQVVARARRPVRLRIVPASEMWRIPPEEVAQHLVISEGAEIQTGDLLLQKKRAFGSKTIESPIEGVFYGINNGRLILQQHEWFELRAMVSARVINAIPNRGIVMEIIGSQIQGVWGSGKEGHGKLKIMTEAENHLLNADQITEEVNNSIPVAGAVNHPDVLTALKNHSAAGLIVGSMSAALVRWANRAPFPIIITDSIGTNGMARHIFFLLRKHTEGEAALFARVPDYWGNRPEIVVPHEISTGILGAPPKYEAMRVGQTVRILRDPYASQIGEVVRLNHYQKRTEVGTSAHGADVKLSNGSIVFVPYANLDTII